MGGGAGSGSVWIPILGLTKTIWLASALNLLVCGFGLLLHARLGDVPRASQESAAPRAESDMSLSPRALRLMLVGYGLSGFSALAYEVTWTRILSTMIGSSVYAFSMMLTAFILGLGLGSLVFARFVDRVRDPMRALIGLQAGIAFAALLVEIGRAHV